MPVYEYYCPSCKSTFEQLRPMADHDRDADCPDCAARAFKKLSVFAAVTRGGGFEEFMPMCATDGGAIGGCACGGACMHGA